MSIGVRGAAVPPIDGSPIKRWIEVRVIPQALNDSSVEAQPLTGMVRFGQGAHVASLVSVGNANSIQAIMRLVDQRRCFRFVPTVAANCILIAQFNQSAAASAAFLDFGEVFPALTGPLGGVKDFPPSVSISAWVRKNAGGDGSDCQAVMGFATTSVLAGQTKEIPRIGLLGDGAGGYRYGSVNCPDGAAVGNNLATDIDVGSDQPTELVAPGTNWWHSRIKLIPPLPTQPGRWAAYHNGVLRKVFTTNVNFPRGHQAVNDNYKNVQAVAGTYFNAGGVVPSPVLYDIRIVVEDDWTV